MRHARSVPASAALSGTLALMLAACGGAPAPSATPGSAATAGPTASSAPSQPASSPSGWEVLEDAPFARLEMAVAAHDGRIWLAGGLSPGGAALTDVEIFDPASGTWSDGPSLPAAVHHAALVSDGARLLLIGGYIGSDFNRPTDLVLQLPTGADAWAEAPPLPDVRAAGAAAWDGERVIYAGGVGTGPAADVYALEGDAWDRIGSMARPREHLAATSDGAGTVWLMGGRVMTLDTNLSMVETVTAGEIALSEPIPTPRGGVGAFYHPSAGACLTGGEAPDRVYTVVECIAPDGSVTTLPELNERHHGHGAAVVAGVAYVVLGGPQPTLSAGTVVEALALEP